METIDRYRRYLKRRNFSGHTIKNYLNRLSLFTTWLTLPVEEVTRSEIGRYIDHLLKKRLSAQTITSHLQTIRLFFDYRITEEGMTMTNPITKVSIRLPKPLPRHLKDDQVGKFRTTLAPLVFGFTFRITLFGITLLFWKIVLIFNPAYQLFIRILRRKDLPPYLNS